MFCGNQNRKNIKQRLFIKVKDKNEFHPKSGFIIGAAPQHAPFSPPSPLSNPILPFQGRASL